MPTAKLPIMNQIEFIAETLLPTSSGHMKLRAYRSTNGTEPIAIVCGSFDDNEPVTVRIHDACFTSEVLGSLKCDCKSQLDFAIEHIQKNDGVVIYLHQEGRGIGLANKVAAYALQEKGLDTVEANRHLHLPDDDRNYEDAADILKDLGIENIHLMTNNPKKISDLQALGIKISKRIPILLPHSPEAENYLKTKMLRMGHFPSTP